jgi:hypothetical protein
MRKIHNVKFIGEMRELSAELVPINAGNLRDLISGVRVLFPASDKYFSPSRQMCIGVVIGEQVKWLTRDEALLQIPECDYLIVGVDYDGSAGVDIAAIIIAYVIQWTIGRIVTLYFTDKPQTKDEQQDKDSYLLNGPNNSTRAGEAVPLVFGRFRCGSVVISQALSSERMGTSLRDEWSFTGTGTFTGNFLTNDANNVSLTITSIDVQQYYNGPKTTHSVPFSNLALSSNRTLSVNADGSWSLTQTGVVDISNLIITYYCSGTTTAGTYTSQSTAVINIGPTPDYSYQG